MKGRILFKETHLFFIIWELFKNTPFFFLSKILSSYQKQTTFTQFVTTLCLLLPSPSAKTIPSLDSHSYPLLWFSLLSSPASPLNTSNPYTTLSSVATPSLSSLPRPVSLSPLPWNPTSHEILVLTHF